MFDCLKKENLNEDKIKYNCLKNVMNQKRN